MPVYGVICVLRTASVARYKVMLEMFLNFCVRLVTSVPSKHYFATAECPMYFVRALMRTSTR
jgi:hypothetical protein